MDFKFVEDENAEWDIYWSDVAVKPELINKMRPF